MGPREQVLDSKVEDNLNQTEHGGTLARTRFRPVEAWTADFVWVVEESTEQRFAQSLHQVTCRLSSIPFVPVTPNGTPSKKYT